MAAPRRRRMQRRLPRLPSALDIGRRGMRALGIIVERVLVKVWKRIDSCASGLYAVHHQPRRIYRVWLGRQRWENGRLCRGHLWKPWLAAAAAAASCSSGGKSCGIDICWLLSTILFFCGTRTRNAFLDRHERRRRRSACQPVSQPINQSQKITPPS